MPMEKGRYPADWKQIALEVKEAAGWRCQRCGKQCRRPGEGLDTPGRAGHQYTLTVHHIDHQPENCARENLVALCAPCHLRADYPWYAERRRKRKEGQEPERAEETDLRADRGAPGDCVMNNKDWKDLHSGNSGAELVNLLVDEVEMMMRARWNASGYSHGYPANYWDEEEMHHAERVAWLREMLYKKFEGN